MSEDGPKAVLETQLQLLQGSTKATTVDISKYNFLGYASNTEHTIHSLLLLSPHGHQ